MTIDKSFFKKLAQRMDLLLDDQAIHQFQQYAKILLQWNETMNLTAIVEPYEIVVKHFLDSLLILHGMDIPIAARVIDVGTGAGFPGLPLRIVRPDLGLTLLDSLQKRLIFLRALCQELDIRHVDFVHQRAEIASLDDVFREAFDLAVSRAVASLPILLEYSLPFVKVGGYFVAYKGPDIEDERKCSNVALKTLGGEIEEITSFVLPDSSRRNLLWVKKRSETPKGFPRKSKKISQKPLL